MDIEAKLLELDPKKVYILLFDPRNVNPKGLAELKANVCVHLVQCFDPHNTKLVEVKEP